MKKKNKKPLLITEDLKYEAVIQNAHEVNVEVTDEPEEETETEEDDE